MFVGFLIIYVLDIVCGVFVVGLKIVLYCLFGDLCSKVVEIVINLDGCIDSLILLVDIFEIGIYELIFYVGEYLWV